jgi:hypothetical protein
MQKLQYNLDRSQRVLQAAPLGSNAEVLNEEVLKLQFALAQAQRELQAAPLGQDGPKSISAHEQDFADELVSHFADLMRRRIDAMQLEHDAKLQECERRISDAEAAHELHVEQLQAQVTHFHDLAMGAINGASVETSRAVGTSSGNFTAVGGKPKAGGGKTKAGGGKPKVGCGKEEGGGGGGPAVVVAASGCNPAIPPPPVPHLGPVRAVKSPCWYCHVQGNCRFGSRCHNSHAPISAEVLRNLVRPSRKGSVTASVKGKGEGKGRGGRGASTSPPRSAFCRFFPKGECKNGAKCPFLHLEQKDVDECRRAEAVAKAKAKEKGKAIATVRPAPAPSPLPTPSGIPGASGPVRMPAPQLTVAGPGGVTVVRRWSPSQSS